MRNQGNYIEKLFNNNESINKLDTEHVYYSSQSVTPTTLSPIDTNSIWSQSYFGSQESNNEDFEENTNKQFEPISKYKGSIDTKSIFNIQTVNFLII
jgi:hypothetical protein